MAATCSESFASRSFTLGKQAVRELVWDIIDAADDSEAETALYATVPSTYSGLELDSVNADPVAGKIWKGYARYIRPVGTSEYTFDTGGGSTKITQSIATIASYAPTGLTAPDFQGAIGVTEDKVEGADIVSPQYQFTETHVFADAAVTSSYKIALARLTGRVNDDTFRGFAAGEVLFLGATGSKRGDENWSITFRFSVSPNATGLTVGTITGIDKKGWEYLWMRYADFEHAAANAIVKRPIAAYVEQVYVTDDFTDLGI